MSEVNVKKIFLLVFLSIASIIFSQIDNVFAEHFKDIEDCKYKDSIIELHEKGIICGTQEEKFEPYRKATIYEFCAMLARAFYPDENYLVLEKEQEWFSPYIVKLQNEGIINGYSFYNWEKGYYNAASFIEIALVAAEYYNRPLMQENFINLVKRTGVDSRIIKTDYDCSKKMLRCELANLINKVVNGDFTKIEYTADFPVNYQLESFRDMDKIFQKNCEAIETIPKKYIDFFNKMDYVFLITLTCESKFPASINSKGNVTGVTDWKNKIVCVEQCADASVVRHEFGHVVAYELLKENREKILEFMYQNEKISASGFLSEYASTAPDEFFAEAFNYFIENQYDEKEIERFREKNPLTTQIIYDNMINCEELVRLKEIKRIIKKNKL